MDPGLRRRPFAYVADLAAPVLDDADRHHLLRVRRLGPDTAITVADGRGRWCVAGLGDHELVDPSPIEVEGRPGAPTTVAFTPVKGDRPEWVVQKLTELGIDRIIVLQTDRSVVRWDGARWAKQERKLLGTIRSAGAQSRRLHLPELLGPLDLASACADHPELVLAEIDAAPLPATAHGVTAIAVGPEGGWSPDELEGRPTVGLGSGVLRAETACLTAAVRLGVA